MAYRIPGESAAEARFRQRMQRAQQAQEEQKQRRSDEIHRQIEYREWLEEMRQWKERVEYDLYLVSVMILDLLTRQRDENLPPDPDGEWNGKFCEAIQMIPEAKLFVEDMSMRIIQKNEVKNR